MSRVLCEVCIDSVQSALFAAAGGADRLELCANLVEGGTTPSTGMIRAVLAATTLPVMVMLRPRGGHFTFDAYEKETLRCEAEAVLAERVAGIVIGALQPDGQLDEPLVRELCDLARGRSVTFHRAFDQVADPGRVLEQLINCGVDRVLTSGQAPTALAAVDRLKQWIADTAGRCVIMPGCGVRSDNVASILAVTGASEIHFSGAHCVDTPVDFWRHDVPMSSATTPGDLRRRISSLDEISKICAVAHQGAT